MKTEALEQPLNTEKQLQTDFDSHSLDQQTQSQISKDFGNLSSVDQQSNNTYAGTSFSH